MLLSTSEIFEASSTNSVDPDQTAPVGAVWSGSTLFEVSSTNSVDPDQTSPVVAVWSGSILFASILMLINKQTFSDTLSLIRTFASRLNIL